MTAEIWELDGSNHVATHSLPVVSDWWQISGVGDFDRDGDSDILLRHREHLAVVWEIEDNAYVVNHNLPQVSDSWQFVGGGSEWDWNWWRVAGTGDFDRDGDSDILWRHQDDGPTVMWEMQNGAYVVNHDLPRLPDTSHLAGRRDRGLRPRRRRRRAVARRRRSGVRLEYRDLGDDQPRSARRAGAVADPRRAGFRPRWR
jgi:hypothetical protein